MKNITVVFSAIAFTTLELKGCKFLWFLTVVLYSLSPLPGLANSIEIIRATPQQDRVNLRVRVLDDRGFPLSGLNPEDFQIDTRDAKGKLDTLDASEFTMTRPEETKPDPAYLIILLDMSGSMRNRDSDNQIKLNGATDGIQAFINAIKAEKLPVKLALVPFGEAGNKCDRSYSVSTTIIEESLDSFPYQKTEETLQQLSKINVCSATNLYQPLTEAVNFFSSSKQFKTTNSSLPTRLGIILFSDGFDVYRSNEAERFQALLKLLAKNSQITVHTMGYGEKLKNLYNRASCSPKIENGSLTVDRVLENCQLKGSPISEFIVDENRLQEIANRTRGTAQFPESATQVSDSLKKFLKTLREYKISYQQPGADRGTSHPIIVTVNSQAQRLSNLSSKSKVHMDNFVYRSLPTLERSMIVVATILVGGGGIFFFRRWSKKLRERAKQNLAD